MEMPQRLETISSHLVAGSAADMTLWVEPPAAVGDAEADIETPALIVELDVLDENLRRMADLAASHGVALRPHFKMHKCPAVALKQMEMGAVGLCCQKVGEAEVMAAAGIPNILVSNEVVAPSKLRRLVSLAPKLEWLGVCADHPEAVDSLERACAEAGVTVHVLVELDFLPPPHIPEVDEDGIPFGTGYQRCGIQQGAPLVALAQQIDQSPHLIFSGLQACESLPQQQPEARCALRCTVGLC
jgi:D-serine deaminase-like pyridoxal phosphate-dependent protein